MKRFQKYCAYPCLIATAALLLNGCATVFHGTTEKVAFSSEPTGAKVYIDGQPMGTTPTEMKLASKKSYTVEFRKEGYENRAMILTNSVDALWVVLDVVFGLIWVVVDAATGAWHTFDMNHIHAPLEPRETGR